MALPINIEDLIRRKVVENARVEYKRDWNPEPILHSICAFANDIDNWGGGYIIIGVEEEDGIPKFPVPGVDKSSIDRINKEILNKCNLIEPRYLPIVEQAQFEGKDIMVLWVPGGESRPYKCPISFPTDKAAKKGEKAYYIRKMSNTVRANQNELKELFLLAGNVPFDDRVNMKAEIADMRPSLLSEYLHAVESDLYQDSLMRSTLDIATDMHLVGGPSEMIKPLNVGLMFFNERPDNFFRYARIEVVDKPDPTGEGMTEQIFTGPLDKQLRDALSYIKNYIIKERIFKVDGQAEADRFFNYPYAAVEEVLSNAVYHKSYQIGEPITVTITPEKMEVTSVPGPDRMITDEDLKNRKLVSKRYRNRRIGDFLKELHMVEGRNTGIPTILKAMSANGSPLPVFETDEERSYMTVVLPIHEKFIGEIQNDEHVSNEGKTGQKRRSRNELRDYVLSLLKEQGELSASEIVHSLGYKTISNTLRSVFKELVCEDLIEYTIPEKMNSRKQKLRLKRK